MKRAIRKTTELVKLSAAIYHELAVSAMRVIPSWR